MNVTLLSGADAGDRLLTLAETLLVAELKRRRCLVKQWALQQCRLHDCIGCFGCWVKTPGRCVMQDDGNAIAQSLIESDLVISLTPIAFGGFGSLLKRALDRSICLVLPFFARIDGETHHQPRYRRYPKLLFLGSLTEPDEESARTFSELTQRVGINFHTPKVCTRILPHDLTANGVQQLLDEALGAMEVDR